MRGRLRPATGRRSGLMLERIAAPVSSGKHRIRRSLGGRLAGGALGCGPARLRAAGSVRRRRCLRAPAACIRMAVVRVSAFAGAVGSAAERRPGACADACSSSRGGAAAVSAVRHHRDRGAAASVHEPHAHPPLRRTCSRALRRATPRHAAPRRAVPRTDRPGSRTRAPGSCHCGLLHHDAAGEGCALQRGRGAGPAGHGRWRLWRGRLLLARCRAARVQAGSPRVRSRGSLRRPHGARSHRLQGEKILLLTDTLDSRETAMPFEYSHFDFCQPTPEQLAQTPSENLGQVVFGERIRASPYEIKMLEETTCALLCTKTYTRSDRSADGKIVRFYNAIDDLYLQHWIVDNLPVVFPVGPDGDVYELGFPIGCHSGARKRFRNPCPSDPNYVRGSYYIYNHVNLKIKYQPSGDDGGRIVSVEASPQSIDHTLVDGKPSCAGVITHRSLDRFVQQSALVVHWTYSVTFEKSTQAWETRWDPYLKVRARPRRRVLLGCARGPRAPPSGSRASAQTREVNIHWFSIVNSLVIVLFLSAMIAMVLLRTLRKDIARYNQTDLGQEEAQEEFGWKLVHGDVFRPPRYVMLLSVFVGTGAQTSVMLLVTLLFACLGVLSPAARGSLMEAILVLYVLLSAVAGYVSARIYKSLRGERWKTNVLLSAFLVPGLVSGISFVLNIVLWAEDSSSALPFITMFELAAMWFGVSVPLCFVGAYFGFKKAAISYPLRTNQIPRQIPPVALYMRPLPSIIVGGVLPFAAIFMELYFILNSLWAHQVYYVFGFLFVVYLILIIVTSEVCILLCYFHLCAEDYHWWWRAFWTGYSTSFFFLLYCVLYFFFWLDFAGFANTVLYFGYSLLMHFVFGILTGAYTRARVRPAVRARARAP